LTTSDLGKEPFA